MANGANGVHLQLREALENYIKSQYFGKSPISVSYTHLDVYKRQPPFLPAWTPK